MILLKCSNGHYEDKEWVECNEILGTILDQDYELAYRVKCPSCGQWNNISTKTTSDFGMKMTYSK